MQIGECQISFQRQSSGTLAVIYLPGQVQCVIMKQIMQATVFHVLHHKHGIVSVRDYCAENCCDAWVSES